MGDYGGGYRSDFRSYNGDRGLEIVPRPRSPPPPDKPQPSHASGSFWDLNDAEMKRRRRVASYKAYSVEGRVKASIRKGFRWIKTKCAALVHGW